MPTTRDWPPTTGTTRQSRSHMIRAAVWRVSLRNRGNFGFAVRRIRKDMDGILAFRNVSWQTRRVMRLRTFVLVLLFVLTAPPGRADPPEPPSRARQILDHVDDLFRGDSSHGRATMKVTTAYWSRTLELEFWSRGKERSLIRILAPKKEKGTATLKVGNDLWNYLPKVNRVIKLPSSMMSASWMGSHFTNDDLVKESRMAEDYDFEITFEGAREGQEIVEVTCVPKEDAVVEWGQVVVTVRAGDWIPLSIDYHDEDLELARTMTYSKVEEMDGRKLPTRLEMVPVDEPNESTVVVWETIDFDVGLDEDFFSLRSLRS